MSAYYNENNSYAAAWLRNLIKDGHLRDGVVDERSVVDVAPKDLEGFDEVHLFAGIGLWAHAVQHSHLPKDLPIWTGSCPCQPFSLPGKARGEKDERHLWPHMAKLISECRPPIVLGEQVVSPLGRKWFSGVRSDLEAMGYAAGGADLCAASVSAPHIRQRLYWGAHRLGNAHFKGPQGWQLRAPRYPDEQYPSEGSVPLLAAKKSPWGANVLHCKDRQRRRAEPTICGVADIGQLRQRVGRIRAYGNAVVPALAREFAETYYEAALLTENNGEL